jgi:3-deoxy-7-phosphoheptulonate synthase
MSDCTLAALRGEIDRIDDAILELIERRLRISRSIAAAKAAQAGRRLTLRPRRQAAVVARLQRRAASIPPAAVAAVWRELMACGLQTQAPTELVLSGAVSRALLEAQARSQFGCVAPISWEADPAEALRRASEEEAVAIIAGALPEVPAALTIFDMLCDAAGTPVAYAIGRVAAEDACLPPPEAGGSPEGTRWSPASWRRRTATQMPVWPDAASLAVVEERLAAAVPLVPPEEALTLKARLAEVAAGRAFLVQGGDCAESFAEFSPEKVRRDERLLLGLGGLVGDAARCPIVHVARAAGQFAKPRSAAVECQGGASLPAYRGDAVNGRSFSGAARAAEPERLMEAYRQSNATLSLFAATRAAEPTRAAIYASHEALLLNYEQALTRRDPATGTWWAGSGHMVWIGERTRALGGAHVEYAGGIANPIGIKCGPTVSSDELLRLIDRLDPKNEPGRLTLIGRFGAARVEAALPALMRAVQREGRCVIWACDPMHGNGITVGGIKTRRVSDVVEEIRGFFGIAAAERVHVGGIHLEMTGSDVTECLGGSVRLVSEADLPRRYLSHCDPRLNPWQAAEVAAELARLVGAARQPRSRAA